ncbi:MAG: hypothetical protein AAGG75_07310 [Bacteroidota bacterium]
MHSVFKLWDKIFEGSLLLGLTGFIHFLLFIVFLSIGLQNEPCLLEGSIWLKPTKFAFSIALYSWTLAALLTVYPYSNRKKYWIAVLTTMLMFIEIGLISMQVLRGTTSHFNISTPFDAAVFRTMGIAISLNFLIILVLLVDAFRLKLKGRPSLQAGVQLGWVTMVVATFAGIYMSIQLQHSVGITDGGTGLPLLQWSTLGGDLRVAHFIGIHGIQILSLIALLWPRSWPPTLSIQLTYGLGALYLLWTLYLLIQALLGQPFLPL